MSLIYSKMVNLGFRAPEFSLPDTITGKTLHLSEIKSEVATVVMFICNHCPFVHHVNNKLVEIAKKYESKSIQFIAISSNDVDYYPQDSPKMMKSVAANNGYNFPYLYDETQNVAKSYQAECTPDFFVFDKDLLLVYRGRFDETRPNLGIASGKELSAALDAIINKTKIPEIQHPSIGCSIKWK
ncbi:Peroxiredoxin [Tenacibaculum sp. MAR_2009_124]|uniref:thioredoxin family protein n=1 Tax=Tenacibaculum sp. MAR_2009_124 TaxID=1250059 RepID=UPI000898478B|nr:thioredoxin family protein [Tenacibaculum sp. MAR_2009_124]SEB47171.1 Peroxiredoxin [Tenacibaculum sp. MAR_2009_124]